MKPNIFGERSHSRLQGIACLLIGLILSGCSSTLLGDVTPPPGFKPTWQASSGNTVSIDISPLLPPDLSSGREVFSTNCGSCHGLTGKGDGENVDNLPATPPSLGSLAYSRKISPIVWFQVVTNGRIDRLMPGFSNSLSDRQRWDVVSYLMSIEVTSDQLADGSLVFTQYCQTCHGTEGTGGTAPDLTGTQNLQRSLDESIEIITNGKGSMPAAGKELDVTRKLNTALYLRSLLFAKPLPDAVSSDQQIQATPVEVPPSDSHIEIIIVSGKVINGSGGVIPPDLVVDLLVYDTTQLIYSDKQVVAEKGLFMFEHVPAVPGQVFLLSVAYKGILYSSDALHFDQLADFENQVITIYETDTDVSKVTAGRLHIFFEFPRVDTLRVVQLYVLSNPTNSLITSSGPGIPVINFALPEGATNLQFQGGTLGERFMLTAEGFGDTQGIPPGTGTQVLFSYDLSYKPDLPFSIRVPVDVETTNIMLPSSGISIKSGQLQDLGSKQIQNTSWRIYTSGLLKAGSHIDLLVLGKPSVINPVIGELNSNLAVGVISLAVTLFIFAVMIYQKTDRRKNTDAAIILPTMDSAERDAVLDAIIALDDQYHAGQIPQVAYLERRTELKNRLRGVQA